MGLLLLLLGIQLGGAKAMGTNRLPSLTPSRKFEPQKLSSSAKAQSAKPISSPICQRDLAGAIEPILSGQQAGSSQPKFARARWGVLVQTLSGRQTLYTRDAQRYFLPASTAKLLTTAAALEELGPQFRFRTSVYQARDQARSSPAVLRITGRGDPSLTDTQLQSLAQQFQRRGVRRIAQLRLDDRYYQGPVIQPSWEVADVQSGDGTPVNSLILNQNSLALKLWPQTLGQPLRVEWLDPIAAKDWRVKNLSRTVGGQAGEFIEVERALSTPMVRITGQLRAGAAPETVQVPVLDPAQHFLHHFQRLLAANQISVQQALISPVPRLKDPVEVAAVESVPLARLLVETNQESNNLYAETLLKALGTLPGDKTGDTAERGLQRVKTTLTSLGVDPEGYTLADGSGLSRHNLVSPTALVQTLRAMARSPKFSIYRASLPTAGLSGTLENRFQDTPAEGILQAKTGSLSGVAALSGYLNSPNFRPLVFSIVVNQADLPGSTLRAAIDEVVLQLTRLRAC